MAVAGISSYSSSPCLPSLTMYEVLTYQAGSMALPTAGAGQEGLCPLQGSKQNLVRSKLSVAVSLLITKATKLPSHSATCSD